jgi:hypothetical protein
VLNVFYGANEYSELIRFFLLFTGEITEMAGKEAIRA